MSEARRFLVKGLLGQGGFGRVYLADLVSAGGFRKEVALKVLSNSTHTHPEAAVRLRDEARLLGLLRHRNIVAVDDLVRLDEGWGVVMEVVHGVDLSVLVSHLVGQEHLVSARAAVEVARGIARALEAAYSHAPSGTPLRAIHRDIKPGNVRITPEGEVKVLDFGIARADFQAREAITSEGRFGSLAYMSPERVMGDEDTSAGDIYALGVVLWEVLVGRPRGRAVLREAGHMNQIDQMITTVQHRPDLGEAPLGELSQLLRDMLAFEADRRPDAGEVGDRLRSLQAQIPGEDLESLSRRVIPTILSSYPIVQPAGIDELMVQTLSDSLDTTTIGFIHPTGEAVLDGTPPGEPTVPDPSSPTRGWLVGAALGALLVVGAGALVIGTLLSSSSPPSPPPTEPAALSAPAAETPAPAAETPAPAAETPAPAAETPAITTAPPDADEPAAATGKAAPDAPEPAAEPAAGAGSSHEPAATAPASEPTAPSAAPPPSTPRSAPPPPPDAPADAPRIRAVKFAASGVERVQASCNGVTGSGTSSALVRDFPAGNCIVTVTVDGRSLSTRLAIDAPRGFACTVTDGALACQ